MGRGRGVLTPQEKEWMQTISNNINYYLKERNKKQVDLSRGTGIPASTLTGYVKGTSLPIAGNVQKIADYFGLKKSDIDPRFKSNRPTQPSNTTIQAVSDKMVQLHPERQENVLSYATEQLDEQKQKTLQNTVEYSKNTVNELQATYYTYNYYGQPASAGTGQYLNDVKVETIELPIEVNADFVIPIYGDSMEPEYHSGDYVFVK
ncbi:LexA family transcriptional regulator, partial [Streptococcus suis]